MLVNDNKEDHKSTEVGVNDITEVIVNETEPKKIESDITRKDEVKSVGQRVNKLKPIVYEKCPYDDSSGMFSSDSSHGIIDNLYVIDRSGTSSSKKPTSVVYHKSPYSDNSDYDSDGVSDESEFSSQNSKEDVESDDENNESGDIAKEIEDNHNTIELPTTIFSIKEL